MNKFYKAIRMPKKRLIKKIFGAKEIYTIGYRKLSSKKHLYECSDSVICYSELFANKYSWYADPILFKNNNSIYLFLEKFDYKTNKGEIACSLYNNASFEDPVSIIKESFHMSFPTVFSVGNDIYMIPETSEDLSIRIYKAYDFPLGWELFKRIDINCEIVDSIVIDKKDNFVTFVGSKLNKNNPLECSFFVYRIFFNTTKNDIDFQIIRENSQYSLLDRMGGGCLYIGKEKNKLLIPTQESSLIDYGINVNFRLFHDDLSLDKKIVKKVSPNSIEIEGVDRRSYIGIHTYSTLDDIEIIDMRYLTKCFFN